ncbi:putative CocE/NonD family hydrolase [Aquibacillus albus]|uniref:CocE/NonD family hydrolase n=1 Tax=Aquibacillus albus TaxID=1168171 RepID=A0ABS2N4L1_9BACI|nr:putative CocE/NonD family hydrolase [Aquibacillus albus]
MDELQKRQKETLEIIRRELPSPPYGFNKKIDYMVQMRDGIKLATHVYLPEGEGPWPTILMRNPYPHMNYFFGGILELFSSNGYAGVLQNCRGTSDSEGDWEPYLHERNDGIDMLEWLRSQEFVNGKIGLYGHSYGAFVHLIIANQLPLEVKTLVLSQFGSDRHRSVYMNGMFRHDIYTAWGIQNSGFDISGQGDIYQQAINTRPHINMDLELFGEKMNWYRDWLTNVSRVSAPWSDGIWAEMKNIPSQINRPVFLIGGWHDHHLDGMDQIYRNLPNETKEKSKFVVGPWAHSLAPIGDLEYPNNNILGTSTIKGILNWFEYQLKGVDVRESVGTVNTYVIRDNKWHTWKQWPPETEKFRFYLQKSEDCAYNGGILSQHPLNKGQIISYRYDPENPLPTNGGSALLAWMNPDFKAPQPGSVLQEKPGLRDDVVTFISNIMQEDMMISGNIKVHLAVSTDVEDTAFTVRIDELFESGESYNIADGITSLSYRNQAISKKAYSPNEVVEIEIELWAITWCVKKGSRIRLDISSSNFPAYHLHSNFEGSWAEQAETRVATQNIHVGNTVSYVDLPISN